MSHEGIIWDGLPTLSELELYGKVALSPSGQPLPPAQLEINGAPVHETSHEYVIPAANPAGLQAPGLKAKASE